MAHSETHARLDSIERGQPEARPWIALLRLALSSVGNEAWHVRVEPGPREPGVAALDGARVRVSGRAAERLFHELSHPLRPRQKPSAAEVLALLETAIAERSDAMGTHAAALGVDPNALGPVAQLAAMPILFACRASLASSEAPLAGQAGPCPCCGSWPTLAEVRGLERAVRLRCGRCGSDWAGPSHACAFCGASDPKQLGSLVPEGHAESRRVSICDGCGGYLKSVTTLVAWPDRQVAVEDLATVELDLAAVERGYARPSTGARPARVTLEDDPPRRGMWRGLR